LDDNYEDMGWAWFCGNGLNSLFQINTAEPIVVAADSKEYKHSIPVRLKFRRTRNDPAKRLMWRFRGKYQFLWDDPELILLDKLPSIKDGKIHTIYVRVLQNGKAVPVRKG
jgi:hypothetical protein